MMHSVINQLSADLLRLEQFLEEHGNYQGGGLKTECVYIGTEKYGTFEMNYHDIIRHLESKRDRLRAELEKVNVFGIKPTQPKDDPQT
jgi:hypothetical protein